VEVQFIDGAELPEITRQVGGLDGDIHGLAMGRKLPGAGGWSNRKANQAAGFNGRIRAPILLRSEQCAMRPSWSGQKIVIRLDRGVGADLPA
jgi:hypothetical protein